MSPGYRNPDLNCCACGKPPPSPECLAFKEANPSFADVNYCLKLTWAGGNSPYAPGKSGSPTIYRFGDVLNGEPVFLQDSAETAYAGALIFHPDWCFRDGRGKDAACGSNVLGGYCHAGGRPVVTLEQYPDYPVYNTGALFWGVAGSCGAETDDILAVFRGESSNITTAFRARTQFPPASYRPDVERTEM